MIQCRYRVAISNLIDEVGNSFFMLPQSGSGPTPVGDPPDPFLDSDELIGREFLETLVEPTRPVDVYVSGG